MNRVRRELRPRWTARLSGSLYSLLSAGCVVFAQACAAATGGGGVAAVNAPTQITMPEAIAACVPSNVGRTLEVGPGRAYASISAVPWESLAAGDTVRIHWRTEPYHEKILIRGQGTEMAPITVCGVAGPNGELPILDGRNATTRAAMGYRVAAGEARGLIHVSWGAQDDWGYKPRYIVIQGLHIRNAFHEYTFTRADGQTVAYAQNAAGIFVERGEHITVRGVWITDNGNGFFVASGDSEEVVSRDIVLEHSRLYGNGTVTVAFDRHHNIYTEAIGMLIQHNYIGPLRDGSGGSALKDRSAGLVLRYNWVEGGARTLDLVEAQDSFPMVRNLPEYRVTQVYGNVLIAGPGGPTYMLHYGGDSGLTDTYRKGLLLFYHNTVVIRADQSGAQSRWRTALFDVSTRDEVVDARNNVVFVRAATPGQDATWFSWMREDGVLNLGVNWVSPGAREFRDGIEPRGTITGFATQLTSANNDPGFVDERGDNFALRSASPLLDRAGSLHMLTNSQGMEPRFAPVRMGTVQPRVAVGAPDLGAFER